MARCVAGAGVAGKEEEIGGTSVSKLSLFCVCDVQMFNARIVDPTASPRHAFYDTRKKTG
jgi:hypothetical protein